MFAQKFKEKEHTLQRHVSFSSTLFVRVQPNITFVFPSIIIRLSTSIPDSDFTILPKIFRSLSARKLTVPLQYEINYRLPAHNTVTVYVATSTSHINEYDRLIKTDWWLTSSRLGK